MPLEGWALLPRGPMREPLDALRRAHVVILTKADEALDMLGALSERIRAINREAVVATAVHEPWRMIDAISGQPYPPEQANGLRVGLVSSIGDPEGFEATVRRLHATVLWHRVFPDHYRFTPGDWAAVAQPSSGVRPDAILTTEKDWVRLKPLALAAPPTGAPMWIMQVRMTLLSGDEALDARLARLSHR
jgi:tetraacyldisaccharide 4'-kinase